MRTLSGTLLAAQVAAGKEPRLRVRARDRRHSWTGALSDSGLTQTRGAACVCEDGSVVRARYGDSGDVNRQRLYVQRIADPTADAHWTTTGWALISGTAYGTSVGGWCALVAGAAGVVQLYWVDVDGKTVRLKRSADNGATWGGSEIVFAGVVGSAVSSLASPAPDRVYFAYQAAGGGGWGLARREYVGGTWLDGAGWPFGLVHNAVGLSAVATAWGDRLAAGGAFTGPQDAAIKVFGYSADGAWTEMSLLIPGDSESTINMAYPSLLHVDGGRGFVLLFYASFNGTGFAYVREALCESLDFAHWSSPLWLSATLRYGALLYRAASSEYLACDAKEHYRSKAYSAGDAARNADLSGDVQRLRLEVRPFAGLLEVVADNGAGSYGGAAPALEAGCELTLEMGYRTNAGDEYSQVGVYEIRRRELESAADRATVRLEAVDGWYRFAAWASPYTLTYAARTMGWIVADLAWRVGRFAVAFDAAAGWASTTSLVVAAGESGTAALRRVLGLAGAYARFAGDGSLYCFVPAAGDAATYGYGGAGEEAMRRGLYGDGANPHNVVQVFGAAPSVGEALDWASLRTQGIQTVRRVVERGASGGAECTSRATAALATEQEQMHSGELVTGVNVGAELYDMLAITDARAGLSATKRRAMRLLVELDRGQGVYQQTIGLGPGESRPAGSLSGGSSGLFGSVVSTRKGIIRGYSALAHTATVELEGTMQVYLQHVPVAKHISGRECAPGAECALIFFDEAITGQALVSGIYGGPSAADPPGLCWETCPSWEAMASTLTFVAGRACYSPLYIGGRTTLTVLRVRVQTADAGANYEFGLYDSEGNRVLTTGNVVLAASGVRFIALPSTLVYPGWYVSAVVARAGSTPTAKLYHGNLPGNGALPHNRYLGVMSPLPTTLDPASGTEHLPVVWMSWAGT